MKGSADISSGALNRKSKKLESKRSTTNKLENSAEGFEADEPFNNLELEYEQHLMSTDRVYLVRVFPIFILFIGLFLIFIDIILHNETNITLYLGIFVTISGIIWKIIMVKVENKRKQELFGK